MKVMKRGNQWHLRRRVPAKFRDIEPRSEVWISLQTDSRKLAVEKASAVWQAQVDGWEARLAGNAPDAAARFETVQTLAASKGVQYMPLEEVAILPLEKLLDRIDAIANRDGRPDPVAAPAVLGTVKPPAIKVSQALNDYWPLARDKTLGKSPDQIRRWENPRKKAVKNFINVVSDKPLDEISADDMLDFRTWWLERIESDEVKPSSANKDFIHLGDILKTVNKMKRLGLTLPLEGLAFKEGEQEERPPFSDDWIKTKILNPGALDGLEPEARAILLGMVNTGYRPSEAACAEPDQFRLYDEVPHLIIRPRHDRQIKNRNSKRLIPLVGISFEALRCFPEGFPTYRNNNSTLSKTVNGFLRDNGLMESEKHVMYSLRHSFEDRMLRAGIDDRIRSDLMGHSQKRQKYGQGGGLAFQAKALQRIAL